MCIGKGRSRRHGRRSNIKAVDQVVAVIILQTVAVALVAVTNRRRGVP